MLQLGIQSRARKPKRDRQQWRNKKLFRLENFRLFYLGIQVCFDMIYHL